MNFATLWEIIAECRSDDLAVSQGVRRYTWGEFDQRASALAQLFVDAELGHQAKVAQHLYNSPEYLESVFAAFKVSAVPVNSNYRYTDDELHYLWDNADVEAVVFHGSLSETVRRVRGRLGRVKLWIWVDDGSGARPDWAVSYEDVVTGRPTTAQRPVGTDQRSADDLLFVYTGGTTGSPKGVMWRQDDLFAVLNKTSAVRYPEKATTADVRSQLSRPQKYPSPKLLSGPPLMHGTGLFSALGVLGSAGSVVLPVSRRLDPAEILDLVDRERVTQLTIVGDTFARPLLAALDAEPDRWDISSLWLIVSAGAMWSAEVKSGLLRHNGRMLLLDTLGSSEAIGVASSRSTGRETAETAGFHLGPDTRVLRDDGAEVVAGSGQTGMLALRGRGPIGYYKDPEKSATTFRVIAGERWTVPGDVARVHADGSIQLLGRGSACINTGGEKVFAEEVEELLKRHPAVRDAAVIGVPDERLGEKVVAVIEADPDSTYPGDTVVTRWMRRSIAAFKLPRHIVVVPEIDRGPNGKLDYPLLRQRAMAATTDQEAGDRADAR